MKDRDLTYGVLNAVRFVLNSVLVALGEKATSQRLREMAEVLEGQAKVLREVARKE